jgi:hypothetical protein
METYKYQIRKKYAFLDLWLIIDVKSTFIRSEK